MNTLTLFGFVLGIQLLAYGMVYPRLAGANFQRLVVLSLGVDILVFSVVGWHYWGSGVGFDFGLFSVNWFWATLLCSLVVESVLFPWYAKRFQIDLNQSLKK